MHIDRNQIYLAESGVDEYGIMHVEFCGICGAQYTHWMFPYRGSTHSYNLPCGCTIDGPGVPHLTSAEVATALRLVE